jgi:hypothetical protein
MPRYRRAVDLGTLGHHHPVSTAPLTTEKQHSMTNADTNTDETGGGFGCWGMMLIGGIVVVAAAIGYLMLF